MSADIEHLRRLHDSFAPGFDVFTVGSLFTGYGGLDLAVGGRVSWVSEVEPAPCEVLARRFPGVPNLGDITEVDWDVVPRVDVIAGGSPCQDVSHASRRREGLTPGTRSNLWSAMRTAIAELQPRAVVWENVRGVFSAKATSSVEPCSGCLGIPGRSPRSRDDGPALRALGRVLGDLSSLGYDAGWAVVRAADAGLAHRRSRVAVVAVRRGCALPSFPAAAPSANPYQLLPTPVASSFGWTESVACWEARSLLPNGSAIRGESLPVALKRLPQRWAPGLAFHAATVDREPPPHDAISPEFVEWLMGLPAGWVTGVPGLTKAEQFKMLGNGVVPQQLRLGIALAVQQLERNR